MGSVFENDRRRFKRFPGNVLIKFRKLDLSSSQREQRLLMTMSSRAQGISEMGVFIPTKNLLEAEDILEISFNFEPQSREVKTLARVTWLSHEKEHEGMGVELYKTSGDLYSSVITRAKRGNWVEALSEQEE